MKHSLRVVLASLIITSFASAACIPFSEASRKIGETTCVTGTVVKVTQAPNGVHYLNFCDDQAKCPFTAVIFPDRLRDVGDVRTLEGKTIEIHGQIHEYDGHAEIILNDAGQLRGKAAKLPPVPKAYDVEQRGHYSAGHFKVARTKTSKHRKKHHPPLPPGGIEVPPDSEN